MIAITEEIFVYSQIVSKYSILSITSLLYLKKTHDGRRERRRENWPSYRQNSSSITALENTTLEGRIRSSRGQTHTHTVGASNAPSRSANGAGHVVSGRVIREVPPCP